MVEIEQGVHIYEVDTFLGCAGVSQAGEKGCLEGPAELGSRDCPLAQTREEGMKEKSHPCF